MGSLLPQLSGLSYIFCSMSVAYEARWSLSPRGQENKEFLPMSRYPIWWLVMTLCFHMLPHWGCIPISEWQTMTETVDPKTKSDVLMVKPIGADFPTINILKSIDHMNSNSCKPHCTFLSTQDFERYCLERTDCLLISFMGKDQLSSSQV